MRIEAGHNLLLITPWSPELSQLLTLIRMKRVEPTSEEEEAAWSPRKAAMQPVPEALYSLVEVNGVESGYAPVGLWSRIEDWLKRNDRSYVFVDKRPVLPVPDFTLLDLNNFRPGQADALVALASVHCGIISAATGYGKTFLMVQIAMMYPDLEIVMTTARKQVVMTIYERLMAEKRLAGQVGVICSDKNTGPDYRVVVSTIRSLPRVNCERCDLLLADECHNFGSPEASVALASFSEARRFGFSASPTGRSDNADLLVEAMFGPPIFDFSYQDSVDAGAVVPLEAHIYSVAQGDSKDYEDQVAIKRHGYWRNSCRNMKIAKIARRMRADGHQVLILCDTLDHVMHIKRELPEAVAAYSNCSKEQYKTKYLDKGFTSEPRLTNKGLSEIREGLESGDIGLCVSTLIFKEGVDFRNLGCLIRAEGSSTDINNTQLPGRLSRTSPGKTKGILVDFMDVFDKRLRSKSVKRINSYKKKGWKIKYEDKL